jgi:hypothetical protein
MQALTSLFFVLVAILSVVSAESEFFPAANSTSGLTEVRGYWWWTWSKSTSAPSNTNVGFAFSGYSSVSKALSDSSSLYSKLPGMKVLTIGGGDSDGRYTSSSLNSLNSAISGGKLSAYAGISYDIEEGDSGLASLFAQSFALSKQQGLTVFVTISNSAPYGFSDGASLMRSFLSNANIDYISPQLYETGKESSNDFSTNAGVQWKEYANAKAAIVPSIVKASMYSNAQSTFANYGVTTKGYIQWAQV